MLHAALLPVFSVRYIFWHRGSTESCLVQAAALSPPSPLTFVSPPTSSLQPRDERDLASRMRVFARFQAPDEHEAFVEGLIEVK